MWCDLFYDKFAGDHNYMNSITKTVSINDLTDGSYTYYSGQKALCFYNSKFSVNFQLPECTYKTDIYKLMVYAKMIGNIESIYVVIGVNVEIVNQCVLEKKTIPHEEFLKKLCGFHLAYTESIRFLSQNYNFTKSNINEKINQNIKFIAKNAMEPVDYTFENKINDPSELNVKLYEYQKCSVYWMKQKEENKPTMLYNLNDEVCIGDKVYYDMMTRKFNLVCDKKSLTFHGGAIIDEVGLGKTLQVISLALCAPADEIEEIEEIKEKNKDTETTEVKKRGRPKKAEKAEIVENQVKPNKYISKQFPKKFKSKATIVFCPNQLCGQWIREFKERFNSGNDVKIIPLMTKRDFDKVTYRDLITADFVVVSFTFLGNACFTTPWVSKISSVKSFAKQKWTQTDKTQINNVFDEISTELISKYDESLDSIHPLIQLIHWHRFVIDEFHEIYKDNMTYTFISNLLPYIVSDHKWVVTATPFNQDACLVEIVNFLTNYQNNDGSSIFTAQTIIDYLNDHCFRRNTKDSVKQEHTLPPIKEEIKWLNFSTTERLMYNAYLADENNSKFNVYLRQLCCHPQLAEETKEMLSNCKTLEDIEKMMVYHYKAQVDDALKKVDKIKGKINKNSFNKRKLEREQLKKQLKKVGRRLEKNEELDDQDEENDYKGLSFATDDEIAKAMGFIKPTMQIEFIVTRIEELKKDLNAAEIVLDGKTRTCDFFTGVIEKIKKTASKQAKEKKVINNVADMFNASTEESESEDDDTLCGICFDNIPESDIGVTICGHIYCYECLKIAVSKYHSCPYCKRKLGESDCFVMSCEKKEIEQSVDQKNKAVLINELGTKLANLITYLRSSGEHTIIFSQWDDLLRRVGRILKDNNIPNVFCRGNCFQRDKAIREFNQDNKIKVIMLSSDSTAAGTNLTKASQVIFIDPIYGTYEHRKGQERQAIGRAHRLGQKSNIRVIRFIIKDSIEEEIYRMNLIEDKKHVSEFLSTTETIL